MESEKQKVTQNVDSKLDLTEEDKNTLNKNVDLNIKIFHIIIKNKKEF